MSKFDSPPKALFTDAPRERPMHRLMVEAGDAMAEVFVVDGEFKLRGRGQERLDIELPQGSYLVKYRAGDSEVSQWVELVRDHLVRPPSALSPTSTEPLLENSDWSFAERMAARSLFENASMAVIVRDPESEVTPADELTVRRIDGTVFARLAPQAAASSDWRVLVNAPVAGLAGNPPPGCYLIRVRTKDIGAYEMAAWVTAEYQTRIFLTRRLVGSRIARRRAPHLSTASIQVVRPDLPEDTLRHFEELTEVVRSTLANERPLMPYEDIVYAVEEKGESPMLGLLGAHLLRLYLERDTVGEKTSTHHRAQHLYDRVLQNLDRLLPGWPDVGALTGGTASYDAPPMLRHSWALIAPGADFGRISPGSYASRIAPALTSVRPWLVWQTSRMLGTNEEVDIDLERIKATKRRLSTKTPHTPLAGLIQQTPIAGFANLEELSEAWGMPQSSVRAALSASGEVENE